MSKSGSELLQEIIAEDECRIGSGILSEILEAPEKAEDYVEMPVEECHFRQEDVYLFGCSLGFSDEKHMCDFYDGKFDGMLWGCVDRCEDGWIRLESSTFDLNNYSFWHRLPQAYKYCRLATRRELACYMDNCGAYEKDRSIVRERVLSLYEDRS